QVAPMGEQQLRDQVLGAARHEGRRIILLLGGQCVTEPGHGTVEVVQVEVSAAADAIILAPAIRRQIRTTAHQAMQHMRNTARFTAKRCPRLRAKPVITSWQPVSCHSRSNSRAAPTRRTAIAGVSPLRAALSTIAYRTKRTPQQPMGSGQ